MKKSFFKSFSNKGQKGIDESSQPVTGVPVLQTNGDHLPMASRVLSTQQSAYDTPQNHPEAEKPVEGKAKAKSSVKKFDPSTHFVRELPKRPEFRRHLAELVKSGVDDDGTASHITAYINDQGFSISSLSSINEAFAASRNTNLLMWASRYNLFVLWSADRQHPWDSADSAEEIAATLEIGKLAGTDDEIVVLLDGERIKKFTFANGIFTTKEPVQWTTPTGDSIGVELQLRFSTFFGYSSPSEETADYDAGSQNYLGTQCHGVMFPAEGDALPHAWPVSPPIISGKVNIASRTAALSPGNSDPLSRFTGVYCTHYLPSKDGKASRNGPELTISSNSSGSSYVALNGAKVEAWAFSPNNVLSWEDGAGHTAWMLFMALPGGPVFMGNVLKPDEAPPTGFSIFGELKGQPSRLSPEDKMDAIVGHKVASGLAVASTLLLGEIFDLANKSWGGSPSKANGHANGTTGPSSSALLAHKIATLLQLEDLSDLFSRAFLDTVPQGGLHLSTDIAPDTAHAVYQVTQEAQEKMDLAHSSATAAERDARDTEEADKTKNVSVATYKAAQASLRAVEAAQSAADAEKNAVMAAEYAREAATAQALDHALAAAQAFNQARIEACIAAKAERRAAAAALSTVEAGIEFHAAAKNFDKLRETAHASGIATKVLSLASEAVEGWELNTVASRAAAVTAAVSASSEAQECHKHMRRMQPVAMDA